jgi:hypothetical protein
MLIQETGKAGRIRGHPSRHREGGTRPEMPTDLPRLPDGSINYDLFKRRAHQLRRDMLAAMVAGAGRGLVRAFRAAAVVVRQWVQGQRRQVTSHQTALNASAPEETRRTEPRRAA